jgi:hypothetical protein
MLRINTEAVSKENQNHPAMGRMVDHFPVHNYLYKRWLPLLLGCGLILATIGLTLYLALTTWARINIHGRAVILGILPFPIAAYAIVFVIGILLIIYAIIHWRDSMTLFETGFLQRSVQEEKTWMYDDTIRFDSHITQIMFGGSVVTTKERIILENGVNSRWVIRRPYTQMGKFIQTLRQNILPGLIDRTRQQLSDGAVMTFHKRLQATYSGLRINEDPVAFGEVHFEIKNRVIKLHQKDQPDKVLFKSQVTHIKNLDLLLDLLENPPD